MPWYPHAVRKPISRNFGGNRSRTTCAILHVDAGGANSLYGWFNNPASSASSHFYVKYDGTVEQYVDTNRIAWTQRKGNLYGIGIETQGIGSGSWTDAQMASISALLRWISGTHGVPLVDMQNSRPGRRGIGYHRMGIDNWRVSGGDVWGPRGKVCPGDNRVRQFDAVIAAANGGKPINNPINPAPSNPGAVDAAIVARLNAGFSKAHITWVQQELKKLGLYTGVVDGYRGPQTQESIKAFQSRHGLVPDGLPGPATTAKLKGSVPAPPKPITPKPGRRQVAVDGQWGPELTKALQELYGTVADGVISGQTVYSGNRGIHSIRAGSGGSQLVAKLQGDMGLAQDGSIGPNFIKTLQKRMGTPQDGVVSPVSSMVTAMQKSYNDGSFRAKLHKR